MNRIDAATDYIKRSRDLLLALSACVATLANAWISIEKNWLVLAVCGTLGIVLAAYALMHHGEEKPRRLDRILRTAAIASLAGPPILALAALLTPYLPRYFEDGTRVAVARFEGPPLPAPYDACRPSEMLAGTLSDVAKRFRHLAAFELPYTIRPSDLFADIWAAAHGWFEGADVVVYGEYTLRKSRQGLPEADEIVIRPVVNKVPAVSGGFTSAPLAWDFPEFADRRMRIDELCSDKKPPFLDNARRLALAVVASNLLKARDFVGGRAALSEAKNPPPATGRCDNRDITSTCPGVLAFYLADLDRRVGNYSDAEHEYRYAAQRLDKAAAFINLGELYVKEGKPAQALTAFTNAVNAEPDSVAALATRALYEREFGNAMAASLAKIDLDRAKHLKKHDAYDRVALARALHRFEARGGFDELHQAIDLEGSHSLATVGSRAWLGRWYFEGGQFGKAKETLEGALRDDPIHGNANYLMGYLIAHGPRGDSAQSRPYFLKTIEAPAYTDDEYVTRANAAFEIGDDDADAFAFYGVALKKNHNAVGAYSGRAALHTRRREIAAAVADLKAAIRLRPNNSDLRSKLAEALKGGHRFREARLLQGGKSASSTVSRPRKRCNCCKDAASDDEEDATAMRPDVAARCSIEALTLAR